ncbi:MAG: hypothetical protein ABW007_02405, partial [Chitinophagaceae bacterium]
LVLSNEINKKDFPAMVSTKSTLKSDSLKINWVRNSTTDILEDAVIYFNNDTMKSCMPAFDECKFSGQTVFSLKVVFPQGESKWVKLEPISSGEINITVPLAIEINKYIFDESFKFVVTNNSIYEIFKDSSGKIKKIEFKLYK